MSAVSFTSRDRRLAIEQQGKKKWQDGQRRHGQQHEPEGVRHRLQEDGVAEETRIVFEADEHPAAEQVGLEQAQPHAGDQRIDQQAEINQDIGRDEGCVRPAFGHCAHCSTTA